MVITQNAWLRSLGLYIEMNSLLQHGNIRCSYGMLRLVHGNDIVINNTYEIQKIHITFYLVRHINDLVVINTWWSSPTHICMLQVIRLWWYAKFVCYSCCIEITLIGSVWISFLRISVEFDFNRNLRVIYGTWNLHWNSNLQLGSRTGTWTQIYL